MLPLHHLTFLTQAGFEPASFGTRQSRIRENHEGLDSLLRIQLPWHIVEFGITGALVSPIRLKMSIHLMSWLCWIIRGLPSPLFNVERVFPFCLECSPSHNWVNILKCLPNMRGSWSQLDRALYQYFL